MLELIQCRRSCSHKTHIPFQNIQKLWKLVQACLPKEFSHLRNSWIILHLKHQTVHFILCHQFLFALFCIRIHGSELVHLKYTSVPAYSFLCKEDRSRRFQLDQRCHKDRQYKQDHTTHQRTGQIHHSFQNQLSYRCHPVCIGNCIKASKLGKCFLAGTCKLRYRNLIMHGNSHFCHSLQNGKHILPAFILNNYDHFIQRCHLTVLDQMFKVCHDWNTGDFSLCPQRCTLCDRNNSCQIIAEILHLLHGFHQHRSVLLICHKQDLTLFKDPLIQGGHHLFP